jgi:hypothetical protein
LRDATLALILLLAPLAAPAAALPVAVQEEGGAEEARDYAVREAAAPELAEFRGGHDGVILTLALIAAIVILVWILIPW